VRRRKKETVRTVRFPPGSQSTLNLERIVANDGKQGRNQLMGDKLALVQQYINIEDSIPLKQFTAENNVQSFPKKPFARAIYVFSFLFIYIFEQGKGFGSYKLIFENTDFLLTLIARSKHFGINLNSICMLTCS
jgi:hypothetical protein